MGEKVGLSIRQQSTATEYGNRLQVATVCWLAAPSSTRVATPPVAAVLRRLQQCRRAPAVSPAAPSPPPQQLACDERTAGHAAVNKWLLTLWQ